MSDVGERAAAFIKYLESVRRLSPHTVDSYRRDLQILAAGVDDKAVAAVDMRGLRRLLAAESKRGAKPASVARRLSVWRMFFDYLHENGAVAANPARGLHAPKKLARLPRALTPDEVAHFLVETSNNWLAKRDAAMFELLYSTGLRVGEMVALDVGDVEMAAGILHIRCGKGGRGRATPFGDMARTALGGWLPIRARLIALRPCSALFVNRRGGRLHARTVQQRVARRAAIKQCAGRVSPHVLRHSCASHFLQSSGDLRATQELLGHSDIASTQIYTRLDFQNLAATYDRAHPRAGRRPKKLAT